MEARGYLYLSLSMETIVCLEYYILVILIYNHEA